MSSIMLAVWAFSGIVSTLIFPGSVQLINVVIYLHWLCVDRFLISSHFEFYGEATNCWKNWWTLQVFQRQFNLLMVLNTTSTSHDGRNIYSQYLLLERLYVYFCCLQSSFDIGMVQYRLLHPNRGILMCFIKHQLQVSLFLLTQWMTCCRYSSCIYGLCNYPNFFPCSSVCYFFSSKVLDVDVRK